MTDSRGFVHLHNHTDFSMLDGAARVGDLARRVKSEGMGAAAITDHGNLFGAHKFYTAMRAEGVKPIIGMEGYVTPRVHRTDRSRVRFGDGKRDDVAASGAYTHMTMWAEDTAGMHNLFRLASLASMEGYFHKPRVDRELLQTYGKGLLATTGCPSGEVQTFLHFGKYEAARETAAEFRDIFGKGNYYVELMDHGLDIELNVRKDLLRIAKDLDLPLVATNDLHYVNAEDAEAHDNLLCVSAGATKDKEDRFKFDGDEYYLKSAEQMRHLFRELPEACDSTLDIAERCTVEFTEEAGRYMPKFPVPDGETEASWFVAEVERGLQERFNGAVPDYARKQVAYETEVITNKGYAGYFLVVADFIKWAKNNGIATGPGRGSGAGSACAYAMGITDLDPIPHGLIFERFLNPERQSMPDFDIDFDDRRRPEVIRYVTEKYGNDRVAMIVTHGMIKAKQAVKDAVRLQGQPFALGDQITKALPPAVMGKDFPLEGAFDPEHPRHDEADTFRAMYDSKVEVREAVDAARGIENLTRQWGVHAAGVVMSSDPLLDVVPLMRREADGATITQFDYPTCETLGLVKMDFLGLRNLTIMSDCMENIRRNGKTPPDFSDTSKDALSDPQTYELLCRGDTLGVFQLDGGGMRDLLRLMQPDNFEDISALIALYRPGPMGAKSHTNYALRKNGKQEITPIHPELADALEDLLGTTYGLIIYQEQVMAIAQKLAGYTSGSADLLRRAMGKKKREVLDAEYVNFESGMKKNGYSAAAVKALWDILLPFSDYAFNKAHSAAYGLISYRTAYLKCHFPAEYMAALLTSVQDNKDELAVHLAECRRMGLKVLPPDVNESEARFSAVDGRVRVGLVAIRNVGAGVVQAIHKAKETQGAFTSYEDFLRKCPAKTVNGRTVESLIKAGAFDSMGYARQGLMSVATDIMEMVADEKKHEAIGMESLFADEEPEEQKIPSGEWDQRELLAMEREMIGLYVSGHPLTGKEDLLAEYATVQIGDLITSTATLAEGETAMGADLPEDGTEVVLAGIISSMTNKVSKKGTPWAILTVEDLSGSIPCLVFSRPYQQFGHALVVDMLCAVRGRISMREGTPEIFVDEVGSLETDD